MKRTGIALAALGLLATSAIANPLDGYEQMDLANFMPRENASAIMLLHDLFEGHPETMEGRPVTRIELKSLENGSALQIDLEMTGYLDDSVSGERYRAIVGPGTEHAFRLEQLGRQVKCGRGGNAGEWTTGTCP